MQYREYGKTGKKVSVVGFGGMRFIKEEYENDIGKCAEIVRKASELGINYFDTAPFYCEDKSEEIMGEAFKDMPKPFYVSTKSGLQHEPTADDVRRRVEKSLKHLGVQKINFFHMWCIMNLQQYEKVMATGGPYEGALKAKEEGLIEHLVISTHCNGEEIEKIVNDDAFEGITLGYNASNFAFRQQGIKAAYKKGIGVVTMNPLGGGIIPQNPDYYSFIKQDDEDTLAQAALKFNISHQEITVALAGIGSFEELEENIKAGENYGKMTPEKLEKMAIMLNQSLDSLCTGCSYCKGCPQDIEIPKLMDAYNMYLLKKDKKEIIDRLQWHWGMDKNYSIEKASICIECGRCEKLCTQHLPIIERLSYIASL